MGTRPRGMFATIATGAVLAVGAAALGEGSADALPGSVRLAPYEPKVPFRVAFPPPPRGTRADAPSCRIAKRVGDASLVFADLDGNGRFDDAGTDGWTVEGNAYLVPFEPPLVVGRAEVRVAFDADGGLLRFGATAVPGTPAVLDAFVLANELRLRNGLPPARLDPALSRACELHAAYSAMNGITHDEEKGKPLYTEEGARAGKASSVVGAASPSDAVAAIYCEFYHRFSITDPRTRALGIGTSGGITCIDGLSGQGNRAWNWPAVVPAPGTADQPREFDVREWPRPYPEGMTPGFPLTLQFPGGDVREVSAEYRAGPKGGKAVPFLLSWPGNPANAMFPHNFEAIALIPESRLATYTPHSFRVKWTASGRPGEIVGEFTTGKRGGALPTGR